MDGHIEAFREIGGVPRKCRYDNLTSVVIKRTPELKLNAQFMDFCRHYSFGVHPCTPRRANEKGRVQRIIRDIKDHLRVTPCDSIAELNKQTSSLSPCRRYPTSRADQSCSLSARRGSFRSRLIAIRSRSLAQRSSSWLIPIISNYTIREKNRNPQTELPPEPEDRESLPPGTALVRHPELQKLADISAHEQHGSLCAAVSLDRRHTLRRIDF